MTSIQDAKDGFDRREQDVMDLVGIHTDLGRITTSGAVTTHARRGRRYREAALNHAVVVLTVAAWQAFAEDLVDGIVAAIEPPHGSPGQAAHKVLKALTIGAKNRYATANAENTRSLMLNTGFDPHPHWHWAGRWPKTASEVTTEMNQWCKVRHAIAHGDQSLPRLGVLDCTGSNPSLTKKCADSCVKFFSKVVRLTAYEAHREFN